MRISTIAIAASLLAADAAAQHVTTAPAATSPRSAEAAARYPQPVRVATLIGRALIEDTSQQRRLGRVVAVTRSAGGEASLIVEHGGLLGIGTRRIAIPIGSLALLGDLVVLKDVQPGDLAGMREAEPFDRAALPPDAIIRMGLAKN